MTRSVEIPDAAVEAADRAFWEHPASHSQNAAARNRAIRAALVAARPYLMPTREQITDVIQSAFYGSAAPALAFEREESGKVADSILALLNGEIKKGGGVERPEGSPGEAGR